MTDTILMAFMHVVSNMSSNLIAPNENQSAFTPEEIVAGNVRGSGASTGNDATIKPTSDDPQLATAVKLARQALHTGSK